MADGDSFAPVCAEKYNLQVNRPVEPPSLPTWEMGTVNIFQVCSVLQIALILQRCGMHSNWDFLLWTLFNTMLFVMYYINIWPGAEWIFKNILTLRCSSACFFLLWARVVFMMLTIWIILVFHVFWFALFVQVFAITSTHKKPLHRLLTTLFLHNRNLYLNQCKHKIYTQNN